MNVWTNSGHSSNFLSCSSFIIIFINDKYKRHSEKDVHDFVVNKQIYLPSMISFYCYVMSKANKSLSHFLSCSSGVMVYADFCINKDLALCISGSLFVFWFAHMLYVLKFYFDLRYICASLHEWSRRVVLFTNVTYTACMALAVISASAVSKWI